MPDETELEALRRLALLVHNGVVAGTVRLTMWQEAGAIAQILSRSFPDSPSPAVQNHRRCWLAAGHACYKPLTTYADTRE